MNFPTLRKKCPAEWNRRRSKTDAGSFVGGRIVLHWRKLNHLSGIFCISTGSILFFSGCKLFTDGFLKGLEKTSGSNYGQEKSDWEPRFTNEKLGNFAASETRLVEILDGN